MGKRRGVRSAGDAPSFFKARGEESWRLTLGLPRVPPSCLPSHAVSGGLPGTAFSRLLLPALLLTVTPVGDPLYLPRGFLAAKGVSQAPTTGPEAGRAEMVSCVL